MSKSALATFYNLTPDIILNHVEKYVGIQTTGRTFSLNSYENRVIDIDLEEELKLDLPNLAYHPKKVVAKFYRPHRWNEQQILEEHQFIQDLCDNDLPIVPALKFNSDTTLHKIHESDIYFCIYPKILGRNEPEVNLESLKVLFRMIARIHQVGERRKFQTRHNLDSKTGFENLKIILNSNFIPLELIKSYEVYATQILNSLQNKLTDYKSFRIHGDCHLGNVLWNKEKPIIYDFDDAKTGPAIQDIWVIQSNLTKQDAHECLENYIKIRNFDLNEMKIAELLRGYRIISFSAWIAKRWDDPIFQRTFSYFNTSEYWQKELNFLREIIS